MSKRKKSLTLLVMSDANKRVIQLKIPKLTVVFLPILFISLTTFLYFSQTSLKQTTDENRLLSQKLDAMNTQLVDVENQVVNYQSEAESLDKEVNRLAELEEELTSMITSLDPDQINDTNESEPSGGIEIIADKPVQHDVVHTSTTQAQDTLLHKYDKLNSTVSELITAYHSSIQNYNANNEKLKFTPTYWPADTERITSEFGNRLDPFTRNQAIHTGIDLAGPYRTEIYAAGDGQVTLANRDGGYGNSVKIKHGTGLETRYGHMAEIVVEKGDQVKKGEIIGYMGSTGRSTGVHLHYEIIENGEPIDPFPYMTFMERVLKNIKVE
ncbi:peptidoglycan DD-metalloendopeptidase family protein [Aquibacillus koreensis]|uniref:Peptidoglycan DD-metalloendopeptidase family protein n=1 Tax=Aquibacillus koreensis TaxID=279446 RepID=A0A9X3WN54_9BACI|nr:peptidoglycan DD-metalloendopeptidase family protein [Aquibacillus koreensis]MCT2536962.1 peptidoglycan DD-metalloendopeptidase family protein [Aquibacillus koreensis]MDC3422735.1 peptidoglycan DD-metalloendopeptidase family protein [Aquibacillus koreensis]